MIKLPVITSSLCAALAVCVTISPRADAASVTKNKTEALIQKLNHSEYSVRESAMSELWQLGERATPALLAAAESTDPELSSRAQLIERLIQLGLRSDSDKQLLSSVKGYLQAIDHDQAETHARALLQAKAYREVLIIANLEKDIELRQRVQALCSDESAGIYAAQLEINKGNPTEAIALLKIAPQTRANLKVLAHLLKYTGGLRGELAKLSPEKSPLDLRLAYLAANLEHEEVRSIAKDTRQYDVVAITDFNNGKLEPVFQYIRGLYGSDYQHDALNRLIEYQDDLDSSKSHAFAEDLISEAQESGEANELVKAIHSAMLVGEAELAEPILREHFLAEAVSYYTALEQCDLAIELIASPPMQNAEEFTQWQKKQLPDPNDNSIPYREIEENKLFLLASVHLHRNDSQLAIKALDPLLAQLASSNLPTWRQVIGHLIKNGAGEEALEIILANGNENNEYQEFSYTFFNDDKNVRSLWESMKFIYPKDSAESQFIKGMSLMGLRSKTAPATAVVEKDVFSAALDETQKEKSLKLLTFAARKRADLRGTLNYSRQLYEVYEKPKSSHIQMYFDAAGAIQKWDELVKINPASKDSLHRKSANTLAYMAVAHWKSGDRAKGDQIFEHAMMKTLGSSREMNEVGRILYAHGYASKAIEVWEYVMLTATEIDWHYISAILFLNAGYEQISDSATWSKRKDCALVTLAMHLREKPKTPEALADYFTGFHYTFAIGMDQLDKGNARQAEDVLQRAHHGAKSHGSIADTFFSVTRHYKELSTIHKKCFELSRMQMVKEASKAKKSHNIRNSLAWLGARSGLRITESKLYLEEALKLQPDEPAYLDTLGEIYFSIKNRKKAVYYSKKALSSIADGASPYSSTFSGRRYLYRELKKQNDRFISASFPRQVNP